MRNRRPGSAWTRAALLAIPLFATGCDRGLSAVDPAGPQAERIYHLTWALTVAGSAVYLSVMGFLVYALIRGSRRTESAEGPEIERRMTLGVGGAVGVAALILFGFLIYNFSVGRALANFAGDDALTIQVVGHQWWWEVRYQDPVPSRRLTTANEIHVPVGRKVRLIVQSRDVIHSFWAPNLHGKLDLIPGYDGTTYFQADSPGVYHGRCAEFCGLQHARMDFRIVAEDARDFAAWYEGQLQPAPPPANDLQLEGQRVFLSRGCVLCHTIRGTPAGSRVGPDLTHLASRSTIASATLPNTRGHLAGWVTDPQRIKPGVRMPPNQLDTSELQALLSYLESLR